MAKTQADNEHGALEMLAQDHKRVQKLFRDYEKADPDDTDAVRDLVETACLEVQIHSMLEEEIFYPAVRAAARSEAHEDLLNKAEVEHESVDELIAKLHELEADDPMYRAYFAVLMVYVKHHVKEEEQTLFPAVAAMHRLDLARIGEDMRQRREELFEELEREDDEEVGASPELSDDAADFEPLGESEDEELEDEQEQIDISRTRH